MLMASESMYLIPFPWHACLHLCLIPLLKIPANQSYMFCILAGFDSILDEAEDSVDYLHLPYQLRSF